MILEKIIPQIKEDVQENNIRYFKTPYTNSMSEKVLLHTNENGDFQTEIGLLRILKS